MNPELLALPCAREPSRSSGALDWYRGRARGAFVKLEASLLVPRLATNEGTSAGKALHGVEERSCARYVAHEQECACRGRVQSKPCAVEVVVNRLRALVQKTTPHAMLFGFDPCAWRIRIRFRIDLLHGPLPTDAPFRVVRSEQTRASHYVRCSMYTVRTPDGPSSTGMAGCLREHPRFGDGDIEYRDSPNGFEAVRRQSALRVE